MNGGRKEIGLVAFLVSISLIYIQRKHFIFRARAGGKYFDMRLIFQHCLKMVWSPKSVITSVLIHEKFTSKHKRREKRGPSCAQSCKIPAFRMVFF